MIRRSLKYSLICGLFLIGTFVLSFSFSINPFLDQNTLFIDVVLFGLFVGFASWEYKNYENSKFLHFWEGMTIGFFVYGIAIGTFIIFLFLYFWLDDSLLENYKVLATEYYENHRVEYLEQIGSDTYEQALLSVENATVSQLVFGTSLKKIFAAFIVTPVVSIILRKKPE